MVRGDPAVVPRNTLDLQNFGEKRGQLERPRRQIIGPLEQVRFVGEHFGVMDLDRTGAGTGWKHNEVEPGERIHHLAGNGGGVF